MTTDLRLADCREILPTLPDGSISAICTDPPYSIGFMGRDWDRALPDPVIWRECLRVLAPGGHLLAFGGTRTAHRLTCAIEDAGFEIRDTLTWIMGSGFPKSRNVSKDQRFCRCATGPAVPCNHGDDDLRGVRPGVSDLASNAAAGEVADLLAPVQRQGSRAGVGNTRSEGLRGEDTGEPRAIGTARRAEPGMEGRGDVQTAEGQLHRPSLRPMPSGPDGDGPVGRLRDGAPAGDGPVDRSPADAHGVREPRGPRPAEQPAGEPGPLADERGPQAGRGWPVCGGCGKPRVPAGLGTALKPAYEPIVLARKPLAGTVAATVQAHGTGALNIDGCRVAGDVPRTVQGQSQNAGDLYGADQRTLRVFEPAPGGRWPANVLLSHLPECAEVQCALGCPVAELDTQSGTSKSSTDPNRFVGRVKTIGDMGGRHLAAGTVVVSGQAAVYGDQGGASRFFPTFRYCAKAPTSERPKIDGKGWPTVKPLGLMRWLVKLVTPPGGLVLDPFAGTGPTLQAAELEGFDSLGIERDDFAYRLACQRLGIEPTAPSTDPGAT